MRRLATILAILAAAIFAFACATASASASSYLLRHPRHERCRTGYARTVEVVAEREHGHVVKKHGKVVKVRETFCVRAAAKVVTGGSGPPVVLAPAPTPAPTTTPTATESRGATTTTLAVHPGPCGEELTGEATATCSYTVEAAATGVPSGFEGIELWLSIEMPWEEAPPSWQLFKVPYRPAAGTCTITLLSWRRPASGTQLFPYYSWAFQGSAGCPGVKIGHTLEWWSLGYTKALPYSEGGYEEPSLIEWQLSAYTPGEYTASGGGWTDSVSSDAALTVKGR